MALLGADLLFYPTAIGSEPHDPSIDSRDHWQRCMQGHAAANVMPLVASNRVGPERGEKYDMTFYGSSFISDPYGRVLVQAGRDDPAVLVADLDLDQRRDWLALFPFLTTRRPDAYGSLVGR